MISFEEWLVNNHPETLNEGKLTNALGSLAITGSLLGGVNKSYANEPTTSQQQVDNDSYSKRLIAIEKASNDSNFKKNWKSDFDKNKEQQVINSILKLKTIKDHDDFSKKLQLNMKEIIRVQTRDSSPKYIEIEKEVAMKGYDYQFFRYLQQLTIASKNVLIQN
jgi:hypothetical protein